MSVETAGTLVAEFPWPIRVPGAAAGLTAPSHLAEPWKWRVAEHTRAAMAGGPIARPVRLELAFEMPARAFGSTALPNLLKSTIDGFAHEAFLPELTSKAGPWDRQDWWVTQLAAEKRLAADSAVLISVVEPKAEPLESSLQYTVIGRPRPWVTRGEAEWKLLIANALRAAALGGFPAVGLELGFRLAPSEMLRTDIDNLVLPAAQAAAGVLAPGNGHAMTRVQRLLASKVAATPEQPEGVTIGVLPVV